MTKPIKSKSVLAKVAVALSALQEEASLRAAADKELEWLRSAKAGSKTKARLKSYDALVDAARTADDASVGAGAIWIPPGPHLGEEVIVAEGLRKEIGDRVLIDDLSFENIECLSLGSHLCLHRVVTKLHTSPLVDALLAI